MLISSSLIRHHEPSQQEILKNRAEKLAAPLSNQSLESLSVVIFKINQTSYAIESKYVKEVFPFKEATPLFEKLPYFKGLLNRKRRVVALIDLAVFLHLSESSPSSSLAMLLTDGIREFAVWIESVERVESLLTSRICFFSLPLEKSHIKGMADNHLPILDGAALLEDPLLVIQENAYCEGGMFKENK